MRNEDVLRTALECGLTKVVKGSNFAYVPTHVYNREASENGNETLYVPENWRLHGVMRSYGYPLALVVKNNSNSRLELWVNPSHSSWKTAKHIGSMKVDAYNSRNPSKSIERFEVNLRKCRFDYFVEGEQRTYITRAHSQNMLSALKSAANLGFWMEMEKSVINNSDWLFDNLLTRYEEATKNTRVAVGESTIHTDVTDTNLSRYSAMLHRVGILLGRTTGMSEEERKPLWIAFSHMEGDLT